MNTNELDRLAIGSSYRGQITCTYSELSGLSELTDTGATDKSTTMFMGVLSADKILVTVYDWKNWTPINPDEQYRWNIGGKHHLAVIALAAALTQQYGKDFTYQVGD